MAELFGRSGGAARGKVVVIPNGVSHWFKEVEAPFLYYVVKVPRAEGPDA